MRSPKYSGKMWCMRSYSRPCRTFGFTQRERPPNCGMLLLYRSIQDLKEHEGQVHTKIDAFGNIVCLIENCGRPSWWIFIIIGEDMLGNVSKWNEISKFGFYFFLFSLTISRCNGDRTVCNSYLPNRKNMYWIKQIKMSEK